MLLHVVDDFFDGSCLFVNLDKMLSERNVLAVVTITIRALLALSVLVPLLAWLVVLVLALPSSLNAPVVLPQRDSARVIVLEYWLGFLIPLVRPAICDCLLLYGGRLYERIFREFFVVRFVVLLIV